MKKKIMIFAIILIVILGGIGTYLLINRNNNSKTENEIIEEVIDEKTETILEKKIQM